MNRRAAWFGTAFAAVVGACSDRQAGRHEFAPAVTEEDLAAHSGTLASDEPGGRPPSGPFAERTVAYLVDALSGTLYPQRDDLLRPLDLQIRGGGATGRRHAARLPSGAARAEGSVVVENALERSETVNVGAVGWNPANGSDWPLWHPDSPSRSVREKTSADRH